MNDVLQKIMLFINEHTLLLIGICVFLILVLIGYLIDNSVKSKRIRKDIKNPDQVPKNIREEIIKNAEEKTITKEEPSVLSNPKSDFQTIDLSSKESDNENSINFSNTNDSFNQINEDVVSMNLDDSLSPQADNNINVDNSIQTDTPISQEPFNDINIDLNNSNDILNIESTPIDINIPALDPDANIMMNNNEYTNDKRLSEILYNVNYEINQTNDNNIFTKESPIITVNNDVNKEDVQIENNNSSDELDRIMRKLSTMNNNVEDDNYTNIF